MLSMFLSILAEGQLAVREDQEARERWGRVHGQNFSEFGVLAIAESRLERGVFAAREMAIDCWERVRRRDEGQAAGAEESRQATRKATQKSRRGAVGQDGRETVVKHVTLLDVMEVVEQIKADLQESKAQARTELGPPAPLPAEEVQRLRAEIAALTEAMQLQA